MTVWQREAGQSTTNHETYRGNLPKGYGTGQGPVFLTSICEPGDKMGWTDRKGSKHGGDCLVPLQMKSLQGPHLRAGTSPPAIAPAPLQVLGA